MYEYFAGARVDYGFKKVSTHPPDLHSKSVVSCLDGRASLSPHPFLVHLPYSPRALLPRRCHLTESISVSAPFLS